jgi:spermidine/putrescine transport system substrate-binding protein
MKRRTFLIGAAAGSAGITACGRNEARLNVLNWSSYVAPDTIANFEREFGLRVRYATYESTQEMLAKVMGGNSGWDVVFPSAEYVQPMRELNLLAPLRHEWLPNLNSLAAEFQKPPWDPALEWAVPYMHGTTGVVYDRKLNIAQWADLWEARLAGKMTMLDDAPEVFGACLKVAGESLNAIDPAMLAAAAKRAIQQKPLLRAYLNAEVMDQLVAGDISAAQAWGTTAAQAMAAAPDRLGYTLPREGFARYADNAAVLRESSRVEAAHRFLNYLLRPRVAADVAMAMRTATCNGAAQALLPPEFRDDIVLYPAAETLTRGEWFRAQPGASQRLRDRLWTEVKSA